MKKEEMSPTQGQQRREFIKTTAVVTGIMIAPGILLHSFAQTLGPSRGRSPEQAVTSEVRWGMLIDVTQCNANCDVCVKACQTEHGWQDEVRPDIAPQWIRKVGLRDKQTAQEYSLPLMCQHCESPPCVDVCPTGASFKRADGVVLVDRHTCIGCRYCMMACPYKARSLVHHDLEHQKPHTPRGKGTVESCNFCVHRIDHGQLPACVEACHQSGHRALLFGDLKDPSSEIAKKLLEVKSSALRADMRLNPGVRYQGL